MKTLSPSGPDQALGELLISTITSDLTSKEAAQDDKAKHGFTTHMCIHSQLIQARMLIIPHAILILEHIYEDKNSHSFQMVSGRFGGLNVMINRVKF